MMAYRRMTLPRSVTAAEAFFVVPGTALRGEEESLLRSIGPALPGTNGKPRKLSLRQRLEVLATGTWPA